jgi:hypothetical protein
MSCMCVGLVSMSTATVGVRWFRDPNCGWRRAEPWMLATVNADCGQVLGIVDATPPLSAEPNDLGRISVSG